MRAEQTAKVLVRMLIRQEEGQAFSTSTIKGIAKQFEAEYQKADEEEQAKARLVLDAYNKTLPEDN